MISKGISNVRIDDIRSKVSEFDILSYYLNITHIPCRINSPIRPDNNPSFSFYTNDGVTVRYIDFATKETGGIYDLFKQLWNTDLSEVLNRFYKDLPKISSEIADTGISSKRKKVRIEKDSDLKCKIRDWKEHDLEYWKSFGISKEWLQYAEVYPISHKIIVKNNKEYVFPADKYAYAYVERKEGRTTLKIYQPYNKKFKWSNKHNGSVVSLWTKIPEKGKVLCICASLKDALCLWANTGIPAIALQGEGYMISDTALNVLKDRFNNIFIIFDNDNAGLIDSAKLSEHTGFTNIILPSLSEYGNPKDISDIYHAMQDKDKFKKLFINLIKKHL